MPARTFPISPRTATALEAGDIIPVQSPSGAWACLQVVELKPRALKHFVVALLPWNGSTAPEADDVAGLVPLVRALTRLEIFTEGGLEVTGNVQPNDAGQERWYGPGYVGKTTRVWGWMATIRVAREAADNKWPEQQESAVERHIKEISERNQAGH